MSKYNSQPFFDRNARSQFAVHKISPSLQTSINLKKSPVLLVAPPCCVRIKYMIFKRANNCKTCTGYSYPELARRQLSTCLGRTWHRSGGHCHPGCTAARPARTRRKIGSFRPSQRRSVSHVWSSQVPAQKRQVKRNRPGQDRGQIN